MQTDTLVPETQTVNETIRRFPATVAVFKTYGIDSCCGGARTLAEAASRHGMDLRLLLDSLESAARGEPAPDSEASLSR